jgi:hypothetical protein
MLWYRRAMSFQTKSGRSRRGESIMAHRRAKSALPGIHWILLDMLHDKLIFRPNRYDHDLPIISSTSPEPKESKQPPPRITQILKRGTPVHCSLSPRSQTTVYPPAPQPPDTERLFGDMTESRSLISAGSLSTLSVQSSYLVFYSSSAIHPSCHLMQKC